MYPIEYHQYQPPLLTISIPIAENAENHPFLNSATDQQGQSRVDSSSTTVVINEGQSLLQNENATVAQGVPRSFFTPANIKKVIQYVAVAAGVTLTAAYAYQLLTILYSQGQDNRNDNNTLHKGTEIQGMLGGIDAGPLRHIWQLFEQKVSATVESVSQGVSETWNYWMQSAEGQPPVGGLFRDPPPPVGRR